MKQSSIATDTLHINVVFELYKLNVLVIDLYCYLMKILLLIL